MSYLWSVEFCYKSYLCSESCICYVSYLSYCAMCHIRTLGQLGPWHVCILSHFLSDIFIVIKGFIDRLHVNLYVGLFYFFIFCTFCMRRESVICSVVIIIPRIWTALVISLHMCAARKDIGRSMTRTRYPWALSKPLYQWAILAPQNCIDKQISHHYYCILYSVCKNVILQK